MCVYSGGGAMKKSVHSRALTAHIVVSVWLLVNTYFSDGSQSSDVDCLRAIHSSLADPLNYLSSWKFDNTTEEGFICRFTGIDCWHPDENKVLNIQLSDMGLKGQFPRGLKNCTSLTGLDLSGNNLIGNIPSDISQLIPFVVFFDLSSNRLSGQIPVSLANCLFLNTINLANNQLTGQIPAEIGLLSRLKTFSVKNNQLTGPVPNFINANVSAENFAGNPGLCGKPLPVCRGPAENGI